MKLEDNRFKEIVSKMPLVLGLVKKASSSVVGGNIKNTEVKLPDGLSLKRRSEANTRTEPRTQWKDSTG